MIHLKSLTDSLAVKCDEAMKQLDNEPLPEYMIERLTTLFNKKLVELNQKTNA